LITGLLLAAIVAASPKPASNPMDVVVESWESLDVVKLNARVDTAATAKAAWPRSPLRTTIELFGDDADTRSIALTVQSERGEVPDSSSVLMVRDGFRDDSIRGDWSEITFRRMPDGTWRVRAVRRAYRCWRGHHKDTFSARPCE
jgi:hypothetical protein